MITKNPSLEVSQPNSARRTARFAILAIAACASTLSFMGCSKAKSVKDVTDGTITDPNGTEKPDPGKVVSALDSLVQQNKGKGLGVVTGFLTGEGKSIAAGLLKQASNAAGERRLLTRETVPLKAATVLIFDALKPTTQADTTLKTDTAGNYTVVLPEGKYFGFAVYLDLETFSLVTTQIPNISPKADTVMQMDTAVAIEDETAPSVTSVYDALAPNDENIFMVGSIPSTNAKINITFSEPMNRDAAKGVILGRIDTSNSSSSLVLADTVKDLTTSWSGDSKELTLNVKALANDVQYGVIIPVSCKDLAKNPLEKEFGATFVTAKAEDLAKIAFEVASTSPLDGESIKPIQNPTVSFNRPVDVFTVMKNVTISPEIVGFWEVAGARATFIHKNPLKVGETFTVTLPTSLKDLGGNALGKETSFKFSVKDYEGAAKDKTGDDQVVALAMEQMFDAYLQGDLGRFGAYFHANFRMVEGSKILSRTAFLDARRQDLSEKQMLTAGINGPVYDNSSKACTDHISRWKVNPEGGTGDFIWAQTYVSAGQVPMFWDKDGKEIVTTELQFDAKAPRVTYKTHKYGFAPDFSQFYGPVNQDNAKQDIRFMFDVMAKTSTLAMEPIKLESKDVFTVDGGLIVSGDTAKVAVKMSSIEKWNRMNFEEGRSCDTSSHDNMDILKFLLVRDGSRWMVLNIQGSDGKVSQEDFNKNVDMNSFGGNSIQPIDLVEPVNAKANAMVDAKLTLKWKGVNSDSVKGYLVGIAEDPRFCGNRPPYGALFFVKGNGAGKEVSFALDDKAQVSGDKGTSILRRAQDLGLPGWERVMFEYVLPALADADKGMAGVFNWKVIALKDSSASQFLANGFKSDRFQGESDFGVAKGYFAVKALPQGAAAETFTNQVNNVQNSGAVGFGDMDQDGYPDFIEQKYGTDMRDRNSYPDFGLDTDGDKIPDFLEKLLDKDGTKKLVDTKATDAEHATELTQLKAMNISLEDTDADGFPNEIEQLLGFNPNDKMSNPGTRARSEAPIGLFSGKLALGSNMQTLSFKSFKDTTGNLWVGYTLAMAPDTLSDTVRASFSDLQSTLIFQIILSKNGPDAGKSFWMRGKYDQFSQLLMGPADIGPSADKKSTVVNGGPYAGQWAASGRGEDVSGRLGGANNGPANPGQTGVPAEFTYRNPPSGITEASTLEFTDKGDLVVVNEVGDTVAMVPMVPIRPQPNGFAFQAMQTTKFANGSIMVDIGGQMALQATGWVVDGHIFVQIDTGSTHKGIPGQMAFKGDATSFDVSTEEPVKALGQLKGWIQQDFGGTGLQGQQTTGDCPAGQTCNQGPVNPQGGFGVPFMQGSKAFMDRLTKQGIEAGATFYVQAGAEVMSVVNDTMHILNAKAPWCNQVVLKGMLISPINPTEAEKQLIADKQKRLESGSTLLIVLEDPAMPGTLVIIDKVLDATGTIRTKAIGVEARGTPPDYGTSTMQCPTGGTNPPPCTQNCTTNPPPCTQNCGPGPGPAIPGFSGNEAGLKDVLQTNGGKVVWFDTSKTEHVIEVDINSLSRDAMSQFVIIKSIGATPELFVFLKDDANPDQAEMLNGNPVVARQMMNPPPCTENCTTNPPPPCTQNCTTNPPPCTENCTTNPPPAGNGPVLFVGTIDLVKTLLTNNSGALAVTSDASGASIAATGNIETLSLQGSNVLIHDASDDTKVYVVLGVPTDPKKPQLKDAAIVVVPQALLAGP